MAFYYFTIESIKQIDPEAIPDEFIEYFDGLSDEMKLEIKDCHPDLYDKMIQTSDSSELDFDLFEDSDLSIDEQRIIDKWESINIKDWHKYSLYSDVLVCKVIPDGVRRCAIHRKNLIEKCINYRNGIAVYGHKGYLCPDCMTLYVEESKIDRIIKDLDERNHEMWIQPLDDTLREWDEYVEPIELKEDLTIYIPDNWADADMRCPEDNGKLVSDIYKKIYGSRNVRFSACKCEKCKKIIMRNSLAQQLSLDCGRIGVPEPDFEVIRPPVKKIQKKSTKVKPHYFVQNGEKTVYNFDNNEWEVLPESTNFVVSYSRVCNFEDHYSDDQLVLIYVDSKMGGKIPYLVLVGYCYDCKKFYIAKEDYEILYSAGRSNITIYDDTGSDYYIQSGSVFEDERQYLKKVETSIKSRVSTIENSENYTGKYAVGDYDDGQLRFNKIFSEDSRKEKNEMLSHLRNPYGYKVELIDGNETIVFYLGASEFDVGHEHICSYNTSLGRELVNYRNIEINLNGKKLPVKRRRKFDIFDAVLYGFMEQSDEDAIFREGLTDPYLVKVLNTRKKQHQLVDIMFSIQENQNAIIDVPLEENIIVQGCAGSGKTVVMLQRLSALKYGNPDFDFENVVVLTPNDRFNTHISGLASSLQLGYVERVSVEKYYEGLLLKYSPDFKLKYSISDEINVDQTFVDYIYSDDFLKIFWETYDNVLDDLNTLYDETEYYSKRILDNRLIDDCYKGKNNKILIMLSLIKGINDKINYEIINERVNDRSELYTLYFSRNEDDYQESDEYKKFNRFLGDIEGYTIKSVFNNIYESARQIADNNLYKIYGKNYLGRDKGTHRYNLYLQLLFAQKFYNYNSGTNTLICIDEGQDISVNEYKLIRSINDKNPIFNIFGDKNQLIKVNRGIDNWKKIEKYVEKPRIFELNENFRNTNQITEFCNKNFNMNVFQTGVDGHKVNEIIRTKFEENLSRLAISDERVAILLPRFSGIKKDSYVDLDQLPASFHEIIGDQIGNGRICVAFVDEVKGIEFDKVYVVSNGLTDNEKYIAYTRALSELTIIYDEDLEERIKENEEKIIREQEKNKKSSTEGSSLITKDESTKSNNVKFGKVKSNIAKVIEYENSNIAYTFICKRCKNKVEMTQKEVEVYSSQGKKLPQYCGECIKKLKEEIEVGKCWYCGKSIKMMRFKYEKNKKQLGLLCCCDDCIPRLKKERENNIFKKKECCICKKMFTITYQDKKFYEEKGWKLPNRCPNCRKKRK